MMILTKITSMAILLVYGMLTIFRVGVFDCSCTHTQQFVVLTAEIACNQCSHSSEDCCQHNDQHCQKDADETEKEEECCTLTFQYVDYDQLKVNHPPIEQIRLLTVHSLPVADFISDLTEYLILTKIPKPPNLSKINDIIRVYGQLRL